MECLMTVCEPPFSKSLLVEIRRLYRLDWDGHARRLTLGESPREGPAHLRCDPRSPPGCGRALRAGA